MIAGEKGLMSSLSDFRTIRFFDSKRPRHPDPELAQRPVSFADYKQRIPLRSTLRPTLEQLAASSGEGFYSSHLA
jgi:hypothetical protein